MAEEQKPKFWIHDLEEEFGVKKFDLDTWFEKVIALQEQMAVLGKEFQDARQNGLVSEDEALGTAVIFAITAGQRDGIRVGVVGGLQGMTFLSLGIDDALGRQSKQIEMIKQMMKMDGFNPFKKRENREDKDDE